MAERGVLYMVWGDKVGPYLERSMASVRQWHPDLPIHVERFDAAGDPIQALHRKSRMLEVSPFEQTLFLDADTVVLGKLDFGFERARRFKVACSINECPWARRYGDPALHADMIEYNTGVLFFTREARPLFDAWAACAAELDSSIEWEENGRINRMPANDQAGFAKAVEDTGTSPFVLPLNWNYRPWFHRAFFGPIRIWHDYGDVPDFLVRENATYLDPATRVRFYPVRVTPDPTKGLFAS
ncbi:MAG TPA: hypothetical protein VGB82_00260 [Alphaproteobacteria bacterium]